MAWKRNLTERVAEMCGVGKQVAEALEMVGAYSERLVNVQGIHEMSAVKNYRLGATLKKPDGRVFKYARAGATLNTDMGAENYLTQHVSYTTVAVAAAFGDTAVVIDVGSGDGVAADGVIAVDELEGGYVVFFPHSQNSFNRRILGNSGTAGAGEMTLELDDPIPVDLTVNTDHAECMASPYYELRSGSSNSKSKMGIPAVAATTVEPYHWLQTWGPCWVAPQGSVSVGNNHRQVVFRHDGSIDDHDSSDADVAQAQHAGFVLANAPGGGQGAAFILLQITQ